MQIPHIPTREITDEATFMNRREVLRLGGHRRHGCGPGWLPSGG